MAHHAAIFSICLALVATISCQTPVVKVHFMDYNSAEWAAAETNIKRVVTNELEDYCKTSTSTCGLSSINNVSASVTFTGSKGTYSLDGRYAVVQISATVSGTTLTKEVLESFALDRRAAIVSGATTSIAFINDVLVYPARDQTDNYVIISISCIFVTALFILNFVLTKKRNQEELDKELKQKGVEEKPLLQNKNEANADESKVAKEEEKKPVKSMSRAESFDQKADPKLAPGKYRKRNRSGSGSIVAGNAGSVIGSSRNLTEDEKWLMNKSQSNDLIDTRKKLNQNVIPRSSTEHPFRHTNIPTIDRSLNDSELATDSKVAARLASNDQLNEYAL